MNKAKAAEACESDSVFRLHPSSLKKKVGRRSPGLACPTLRHTLLGAKPTALRGPVFERQTDSHAHAKPWAWHPDWAQSFRQWLGRIAIDARLGLQDHDGVVLTGWSCRAMS